MRIDRVFKGALKTEEELVDDGMCRSPGLRAGRQYLIYTDRLSSGRLSASGCTRSTAIENAGEDLAFLREYAAGRTQTELTGTVQFRPDERDDVPGSRTPMKDVIVTISSKRTDIKQKTDASGRYSVRDITPGKYLVHAELPGFRTDWAQDEVTVPPFGCGIADVLMKVHRSVEGIVRDGEGNPIEGVPVELVPSRPDPKPWLSPVQIGRSNQDGKYTIGSIPAGEYYLGINIESTPTVTDPYPPSYYPGVPDVRQAVPVVFTTSASVQSYDLTAPRKLTVITVHGRLTHPAGQPAVKRSEVRLRSAGNGERLAQRPVPIDSDGHFSLTLCEGVRYRVYAWAEGENHQQIYSTPVEFTAHAETEVALMLEKNDEEFFALEGKLNRQNRPPMEGGAAQQ